jgi:uncharacterized protein involved in outer membrane biogenesis
MPGSSRRWPLIGALVLLALLAGVAIEEWLGWPFLAAPLQRVLSDKLDRPVRISANSDLNTNAHRASSPKGFHVHFLGGVRLYAPQLEIAAPTWSASPHLLLARDIALELRYTDLWRAYRGQPLRIKSLQADFLDAHLEREADGRATWQFGPDPTAGADEPLPLFDHLQVANGTLRYRDDPYAIDTEARFSLKNGSSLTVASAEASASSPASVTTGQPDNALQLNATGHYLKLPLKIDLASSGVLPLASSEALTLPVQVNLDATVGGANLVFRGSATDALHLGGIRGRFSLKGPSLAAVGSPIGMTLPTTAAFRAEGQVDKQGTTTHVIVDDATVGGSRLNGTFTYETARKIPLLSGRLTGPRLLLVDLGPAVGTTPATPELAAAPTTTTPTKGKGKVLPARPFDLVSLRIMDADILIDIKEVNLNTDLLEPLRPLQGHLTLAKSVLSLNNLNAHLGDGSLKGNLQLDGRGSKALWNADLRWKGIRLERWIHQKRKKGSPPYVSGRLNGYTHLKGEGRSTAEILGSLKGHVRTELHEGAVSHLGVELAGLHLIESLGLFLKGDATLPVQCAVADLKATGGLFRPRLLVVDTPDSAVWVDGSVSLATEALDLRAVVTPKDFSPLSLRTPLRVRGTFANPKVSLENRPLGLKLGRALLLSLLNPLAALLPLVDPGDAAAAKRASVDCQNLMQRSKTDLPAVSATP